MVLCSGMVSAQIVIRTDGVNIGGGLDVGSSRIVLTKPLAITDLSVSNATFGSMTAIPQGVEFLKSVGIGPYTIQKTGLQDVEIGYGDYGLQLGLSGMNVQSRASSGTAVNPGAEIVGPAAYLRPISHLRADLGSANTRFRYLYVKKVQALESSYASDGRYKKNIRDLGASASLLEALRPVSFDFKADVQTGDTVGLQGKVGFIAQEVREVLPGLVEYLPEADLYTLNYVGMIPYLVKAFQEERLEARELREENRKLVQDVEVKAMVESLRAMLQPGTKAPQAPVSNEDFGNRAGMQDCKLYQNQPNPFTETTVIRYELPQGTRGAGLQVFDMQGRKVMERELPQGIGTG